MAREKARQNWRRSWEKWISECLRIRSDDKPKTVGIFFGRPATHESRLADRARQAYAEGMPIARLRQRRKYVLLTTRDSFALGMALL